MQVVPRSWVRGVGVGLVALAVLAGCSSGDDGGGEATEAPGDGDDTAIETTTTAEDGADDESDDGSDEGSDDEAVGGLGTDSLCSLLSEDVVEDVLGSSVQVAVDTAEECTYDQERTDEAIAVATVALEAGGPDQFEFDRTNPIGGEVIEDVPGVGDDAIYGTGFDILRVLVGDQIVTFSVVDFNVTDKKGAAIALANELITNL